MRVTIDPSSLEATASVMRTAAEVLGELSPQVSSSVDGVVAPPGIAAYVQSGLSSAASAVHGIALELYEEAADLERRAACCCEGEASSLPVPALLGLAFGAGAALTGNPMQVTSAVSAVAASGPGVAPVVAAPAAPMSLHEALASTTLGGTAPAASSSIYGALGSTTIGGTAPAASSIYEALGSGTFGGGSPVGTGISMVYNPTAPALAPGVTMVPNPNAGPISTAPRIPFHSSSLDAQMINIAMRPGGDFIRATMYEQMRLQQVNPDMLIGG